MIVLTGYVTSPEFCNLIGAFTFLRAAILLAQEIARMSPDPLSLRARGVGSGDETSSFHKYGTFNTSISAIHQHTARKRKGVAVMASFSDVKLKAP